MAGKGKTTEQQQKEMCRLYMQGKDVNTLAQMFEVSPSSVRRMLKRNGITLGKKAVKYTFTQEEQKDICMMYEQGCTYAQIREKYGIKANSSLVHMLRRYNVKPVRKKARKERAPTKKADEQLCWTCVKATGKCSWSDRSFTPVQGWTAAKVVRETKAGRVETYKITACPEYVKG